MGGNFCTSSRPTAAVETMMEIVFCVLGQVRSASSFALEYTRRHRAVHSGENLAQWRTQPCDALLRAGLTIV
jgi:hypothetical protein